MCFPSDQSDDKSGLSLANEQQFLLVSWSSVQNLHDNIAEKEEECTSALGMLTDLFYINADVHVFDVSEVYHKKSICV